MFVAEQQRAELGLIFKTPRQTKSNRNIGSPMDASTPVGKKTLRSPQGKLTVKVVSKQYILLDITS